MEDFEYQIQVLNQFLRSISRTLQEIWMLPKLLTSSRDQLFL
jgi:hypothetical protein